VENSNTSGISQTIGGSYGTDMSSGFGGTSGGSGDSGKSISETAQQTVQEGRRMAGDMMDQARDQIKSSVITQKDRAAESLDSITSALLTMADTMNEQQHPMLGQCTSSAAELVDGVTGYLKARDVDEIIHDVEGYARRNPAVFLGTAFALGFMAARFLKSSSGATYARSDSSSQGTYDTQSSYGYGAMSGRTDLAPTDYGTGYSTVGTQGSINSPYSTSRDTISGSVSAEAMDEEEVDEVTGTYR